MAGVLVVGGCTAAVGAGGPCVFDPPPGDFADVRVVNDTPTDVFVVVCGDARCRRSSADGPSASIRSGSSATLSVESCSGDTVGVGTSSSGPLSRCVVAPTLDGDDRLPDLHLSGATACAASG